MVLSVDSITPGLWYTNIHTSNIVEKQRTCGYVYVGNDLEVLDLNSENSITQDLLNKKLYPINFTISEDSTIRETYKFPIGNMATGRYIKLANIELELKQSSCRLQADCFGTKLAALGKAAVHFNPNRTSTSYRTNKLNIELDKCQVALSNYVIHHIRDGLFLGSELNEVALPHDLMDVSHSLFANCIMLEKVKPNYRLVKVGAYAFANTTNLKTISFENSSNLRIIDTGAFYNSGIKQISLPGNVKIIGDSAFEKCKDLRILKLPRGLKSLGAHVFDGCDKLSKIYLPINYLAQSVQYKHLVNQRNRAQFNKLMQLYLGTKANIEIY
jgi:hypothetical protein